MAEEQKNAGSPQVDKPAGDVNAKPNAGDKAKAAAGAAANAAKDMAKAGFGFVSKLGGKAGQKVTAGVLAVFALPAGLFRGTLAYRLVTLGFAASIVLLAFTGTQLFRKYMPKPKPSTSTASVSFNAYMEQEKEYAIATSSLVFLEKFTTSVQSSSKKVHNLEVEVYVECDTPETARVLKTRMSDVREMVAGAIQDKNYDHLLTPQGMDSFKGSIRQAINRGLENWNLKGSIRRIFLTQFLMS